MPADSSTEEYPDRTVIAAEGPEKFCELMGSEYCTDTDGDIWPDVVEEANGWDPSTDECMPEDCIGIELEEFLVSLQSNTLFILDASGSMAGDAGGGQSKMAAAKEALVGYVNATPEFADLGLMVYGHKGDNSDAGKAESCAGVETLAPIGEFTPESAAAVVGQFEATGWTPIAGSLDAAGGVIADAVAADAAEGIEGAPNRIILISDGIETCDGDPVASAEALVDAGVEVVVDVIGFDIGEADRAALQAVADTTGGVYRDASDGQSLTDVLQEYTRQQSASVDVISCQMNALANVAGCQSNLLAEGSAYFSELATQADSGQRQQFINDWSSALRDEVRSTYGARTEDMRRTLSEFQSAFEEVNQRIGDLTREKVNKMCPAVSSGTTADPGRVEEMSS